MRTVSYAELTGEGLGRRERGDWVKITPYEKLLILSLLRDSRAPIAESDVAVADSLYEKLT